MNLKKIVFTCAGLLLVAFCVMAYLAIEEDKKFFREGIRAEGTVLAKYKTGTRKNKSYTMDVAMFTKGTPKAITKSDTTGKRDIDKKLDAIFDKVASERVFGEYQTVNVNINSDDFRDLNYGDKVIVVYLKENPGKVKLLSHID